MTELVVDAFSNYAPVVISNLNNASLKILGEVFLGLMSYMIMTLGFGIGLINGLAVSVSENQFNPIKFMLVTNSWYILAIASIMLVFAFSSIIGVDVDEGMKNFMEFDITKYPNVEFSSGLNKEALFAITVNIANVLSKLVFHSIVFIYVVMFFAVLASMSNVITTVPGVSGVIDDSRTLWLKIATSSLYGFFGFLSISIYVGTTSGIFFSQNPLIREYGIVSNTHEAIVKVIAYGVNLALGAN